MSRWKKFRYRFETLSARFGFWLFPKIPYRFLRILSKFLGRLAFIFASSERKVALANLEVVFGGIMSKRERKKVAKKCFQSLTQTTLETLAAQRLLDHSFEDHFEFQPGSLELLKDLTSRNRGLIALTFHFGNWEWLSLAWGMAGFPVTAVAQRIKNSEVEKLFYANRAQYGHRIIPRRNAAPQLYKALKRKEIIGLLVDLNSTIQEGGRFFEFFGLPVLTTRSVGLLAMRTGAPIVCSVAYPKSDGRYCIEIGPEILYDPEVAIEEEMNLITRRWLVHCEETIRKKPEFWMWMYKRWKVRPTSDQGRYPFYSFYDPKVSAELAPT